MLRISKNGMRALLLILKDFTESYNSNTLSKKLGISMMGALKILKVLEAKGLVEGKMLGRATFYRFCHESDYAKETARFLLLEEAQSAPSRVVRWARELKKLEGKAEFAVVFGSVLSSDNYNDVDVLVVCAKPNAKAAKDAIAGMNRMSNKKIHALLQTPEDLASNIKSKNPAVLAALRNGIVAFGAENYLEMLSHAL